MKQSNIGSEVSVLQDIYRTPVENSFQGGTIFQGSTQRFVYDNSSLARMLGCIMHEFTSLSAKKFEDFFHSVDKARSKMITGSAYCQMIFDEAVGLLALRSILMFHILAPFQWTITR